MSVWEAKFSPVGWDTDTSMTHVRNKRQIYLGQVCLLRSLVLIPSPQPSPLFYSDEISMPYAFASVMCSRVEHWNYSLFLTISFPFLKKVSSSCIYGVRGPSEDTSLVSVLCSGFLLGNSGCQIWAPSTNTSWDVSAPWLSFLMDYVSSSNFPTLAKLAHLLSF